MMDNAKASVRRILVADDEPISRQVLTSMLEKLGYEVEAVNDGLAAWQRLQQPDAPRLVILDWIMPGLEGIEVCRRVRAWRQDDYAYVYMILLHVVTYNCNVALWSFGTHTECLHPT